MNTAPTPALRTSALILRWRWLLMIAISVIVFLMEAAEHIEEAGGTLSIDYHFVREVILLGIVLPLLGGFTLTVLGRVRGERAQSDQQRDIGRRLATAGNWEQLTAQLVELPRSIVPVSGSSLWLYSGSLGRFEPVAQWHAGFVTASVGANHALEMRVAANWFRHRPGSAISAESEGLPRPDHCRACAMAQDSSIRSLVPCYVNAASDSPLNSYCLPLVHGNRPIALLHFALAGSMPLSADHMRFLTNVAPTMALAIEAARPQRSASIQAEATAAERQRVAQDLHDTLGQNIAYLRLKLDQLTGQDAMQEIAAVHQQLEQMRHVADQAYQQVRGTLINLRPEATQFSGLKSALTDLLQSLNERADLKTGLSSEGIPFELPTASQQQVLYILQEALTNVEKHSRASSVSVKLLWTESKLTISVVDDGCGFDSAAVKPNGHFGLAIMQERAQTIGADLVIRSQVNHGTELELSLPMGAASEHDPDRATDITS